MRTVLLCGISEPEKILTGVERTRRWRERNPEKAKASNKKFLADNPGYHREYWYRRK